MAVAGQVVEPAGINVLRLLWGISQGDPGPGAAQGLGSLFSGGEAGMFGDFAKGYRKGLGGGYVADNPYLDYAMDPNAANGMPQRLKNSDSNWDAWFNRSQTTPDGKYIPSLMETTGQRTWRNFGGFDLEDNMPSQAQDSSVYRQLFGKYDPVTGKKSWSSFDRFTDPTTAVGEYNDPKNWGARLDAPGSNYQKAIDDNEYLSLIHI